MATKAGIKQPKKKRKSDKTETQEQLDAKIGANREHDINLKALTFQDLIHIRDMAGTYLYHQTTPYSVGKALEPTFNRLVKECQIQSQILGVPLPETTKKKT